MVDDFVPADEDAAQVARDLRVRGGVLREVTLDDAVDDKLVVNHGAHVMEHLRTEAEICF